MAAKVLVLKSILRILTPDEINELSSSSTSSNRVNLTELVFENFLSEKSSKEAEVISLEEYKKSKGKGVEGSQSEEADEHSLEEVDGNLETQADGSEQEEDPTTKQLEESSKVESLAEFLFHEKEKLHKNNVKIKHKEILGLYKKNAELDIEQQKRFRDDLSKSSSTGVLINKKQA